MEHLFRLFEQRGADRTGLRLVLAISRQGVEHSDGSIRVRDLPGKGCISPSNCRGKSARLPPMPCKRSWRRM